MLEHDPEPAAHGVGLARHVVAEDPGAAAPYGQERGENPEERALATAIRPEEAEELARLDPERDAVERRPLSVAVAQTLDLDRRRAHRGRRRCRSRRSSASVTR
jgi:hypothetical protein